MPNSAARHTLTPEERALLEKRAGEIKAELATAPEVRPSDVPSRLAALVIEYVVLKTRLHGDGESN